MIPRLKLCKDLIHAGFNTSLCSLSSAKLLKLQFCLCQFPGGNGLKCQAFSLRISIFWILCGGEVLKQVLFLVHFLGDSAGKESTCNTGDLGWEDSPGEGKG